jgi:hypothetical protein
MRRMLGGSLTNCFSNRLQRLLMRANGKRMSMLTRRYLREYGIDREDGIVDKASCTLELLCVGDEEAEP